LDALPLRGEGWVGVWRGVASGFNDFLAVFVRFWLPKNKNSFLNYEKNES